MRQKINHVFTVGSVLVVVASLALSPMMPALAGAKAPKLTEEQKIIHLLNRTGYGPRPGDVQRVKQMGIEKYIEQQLHPERINDSAIEARLKGLNSLHMDIAQVHQKYPAPQSLARNLGLRRPDQANQPDQPAPQPGDIADELNKQENRQKLVAYYAEHGLKFPRELLQELQSQKIIRAVYSECQLQEVVADFWFNHFNIFWDKGADRWLTTDFEMNAIRPNVLGKFKDLVSATAKSPAMLFYLDNHLSASPDAQPPGRRISPRRPRLLALLGIQFPNEPPRQPAANQRRKPGINENYARELMELHTMGVDGGYTQKDVQEVARCFTGWTIDQPQQRGQFVFRDWMHDNGEKVVLGHKIPAGGGINDGEKVIDILVHHPSTAKFIATKLVRRFLSDHPPRSLVDRVAKVYTKTDGDIRQMLKAIFTSKEFYSPEAYRAKIKSPFELVVSAIRAFGGDTTGSPRLAQFIARMGQPLYQYQPPTGYPDRAEQWVNTGALLERLNFGLALSANRIAGTTIDLKRTTAGLDGAPTVRLIDRAMATLLNDEVSAETRAVLEKQLNESKSAGAQTAQVFGLVLGSPEFQRR
jgi:uncharacterized protein (DUF1800 family)